MGRWGLWDRFAPFVVCKILASPNQCVCSQPLRAGSPGSVCPCMRQSQGRGSRFGFRPIIMEYPDARVGTKIWTSANHGQGLMSHTQLTDLAREKKNTHNRTRARFCSTIRFHSEFLGLGSATPSTLNELDLSCPTTR